MLSRYCNPPSAPKLKLLSNGTLMVLAIGFWAAEARSGPALAGSAFCVFVEVWLNRIDALTWDWPWWSATAPWLIFVFGYLWFFLIAFHVHDLNDTRRQAKTVGLLWGIAAVLVLVFGVGLGWI